MFLNSFVNTACTQRSKLFFKYFMINNLILRLYMRVSHEKGQEQVVFDIWIYVRQSSTLNLHFNIQGVPRNMTVGE